MFNNGIILGGGKGSRMLPLTNYIPKGFIEIDGVSLIDGVIKLLKDFNVNDIYITYGHLSETLFNGINKKVKGFINTTNNDNSYFLFNSFVKYIDQPIIIITSDLKIDIDLYELYEDYLLLGEPLNMIVGTTPDINVTCDYIISDKNNIIISIDRKLISNMCGTGLQVVNPYKINKMCNVSDNFYDVWHQLMKTNNLKLSNVRPNKWISFDNISQIL